MDNVNSLWDSYRRLLCSVIVYCKCYYCDLWPYHALSIPCCSLAAHNNGGLYSQAKIMFIWKFFALYIPKVSQGVHFVCLNFYTKTDLFWLIKYWLTPFLEQLWILFKFRVCVVSSHKVWILCNNGHYFVWINALRSRILLNKNSGLISSGLKLWLLIKEQFYISEKN